MRSYSLKDMLISSFYRFSEEAMASEVFLIKLCLYFHSLVSFYSEMKNLETGGEVKKNRNEIIFQKRLQPVYSPYQY